MNTMIEMLSYPFMVRAFTVGILVSLCSALLGVSLVLKRDSMIGSVKCSTAGGRNSGRDYCGDTSS